MAALDSAELFFDEALVQGGEGGLLGAHSGTGDFGYFFVDVLFGAVPEQQ